ncbi:MAG: hypothetical protein ACI8XB_001124 [Patiriisocius sp.]|jgi:hypothetical protein
MKKILALSLLLISFSCTDAELMRTVSTVSDALGSNESTSLSNDDVIAGLKKALDVGIENATNSTSKTDGFFKNAEIFIPFPEEAIKVKTKLEQLGMDGQINKFVTTLNRSAEEATKAAVPIFLDAIKGMSITDGFNILKGSDNAATNFLKQNTYASLKSAFAPRVQAAIEKVKLTNTWEPLATAYNTATLLTGGNQVNPNLEEYVTERAIDGLFVMMAKEEKQIRVNPAARVTDLLKKVFGSLDG